MRSLCTTIGCCLTTSCALLLKDVTIDLDSQGVKLIRFPPYILSPLQVAVMRELV